MTLFRCWMIGDTEANGRDMDAAGPIQAIAEFARWYHDEGHDLDDTVVVHCKLPDGSEIEHYVDIDYVPVYTVRLEFEDEDGDEDDD